MKNHILWRMKIDANTLFSALANEIRLRCLMLLQLEGELCVCELTHALKLSQPMVSRHLGILRDSGMVTDRRAGQWIYYSLNPVLDDWAKLVLQATAEANKKQTPFISDARNLWAMPNRPDAACCA